ncbi:DUF1501 domain-containing protein [Planctomicrobium piriforme]|uniref:Tat (Twin-arginine translocation) pathway signal sequence n=1 Tax=Planctomicrobium piriforme TaxID=1576369 RepID=A0A1I3MJD8_9PLAN|nr:DUF1501 domain-containing protein [Planctomicrobium piriforme]SFI96880.1 Protein of unknown function [Planctomicrobium piriforme]
MSKSRHRPSGHPLSAVSRRNFLMQTGLGFGSVALAGMLQRDALAESGWTPPTGQPHFAPKAKSVIWLFMIGGTSQYESFDPKPELNKYAGKTIESTPHASVLKSPFLANERIVAADANGQIRTEIYPMQIGYRKYGECGHEISDWWPHVGSCADDLCLIRSMWTEDSNHGAQLQFHTGRHRIEGFYPTIGSWVNYGLGSLNDNLPQFVVLGKPVADCCGGLECHRANYLGPQHDGVPLAVDPLNPLPYARPEEGIFREEQAAQFQLMHQLNQLTASEFPDDRTLNARIRSYELAFRMQTAIPETVQFNDETKETQSMYGLDQPETKEFGEQLLTARRLVQRGTRFIQVYHGGNGAAGGWDSHSGLKKNHEELSKQVDQPIAALLKDLKRQGLLDETLVVWATEFGRTPGSQGADGRDHHPYGFSIWLAGGGIKGGIVHGATDELGFHAVENRHYVTDVHATVLHQLGLNPRLLAVPGRKRIAKDYGEPIHEIMV